MPGFYCSVVIVLFGGLRMGCEVFRCLACEAEAVGFLDSWRTLKCSRAFGFQAACCKVQLGDAGSS